MSLGGFRARQVLLLAVSLVVIVGLSLYVQVSEVTRHAVGESMRDARYVGNSLSRRVIEAVGESRGPDPYDAVRTDEDIRLTLDIATAHAPGLLFAAFADPDGRVIVHSHPFVAPDLLPPAEPIPDMTQPWAAWRVLRDLQRDGLVYEEIIPLDMGDERFGAVRVGLSSAFLREEIGPALWRGVVVALGQILLGLIAAYALTRLLLGPLRELRQGIEALRRGDFSFRVKAKGIDEFASMADALNELGERFGRSSSGDSALSHAMEHLGDGLLMIDAEGTVTHVNGIAARRLGLDPATVRGRPVNRVFAKDHPVRRLTDDLLTGSGDRLSARAELPSGDADSGILAVAHRLRDGDDSSGVLVELKDLNALTEFQAVMDHNAALAHLGEMAAGVAHEIRNPLSAISLHLEPLRNPERLDPADVRTAVAATREQIARLDRAVTGFLKVSRLRKLTLRPVDLPSIVDEVAGLLAPEATMAGLELRVESDPDLPEVSGDLEVLRQAVLNLVKNAVQALPSRGGRVDVRVFRDERGVCLEVADTGPGIPAETLPRVFDLYMTTKEGGTGVGLAFVRQAAEMHRGRVHVDSDPDRGTRFTVHLRAASPVEAEHV